jgi:hypothetical protein
MNLSSRNPINRRDVLKNGTLALSLGAIVAACGSDRGGPTDPGKIGVEELPNDEGGDTSVDDAVLLRTLQSLEHTAVDLHTRLLDMGAFGGAAAVAQRFVSDHEGHSEAIGALVTQAGGSPYACANSFVMGRAVEPVLAAVEKSDDAGRDALAIANAFESLLGASYQALVAKLSDGALRVAAMQIGGEEHRHAAVAALAANPDPVYPGMMGQEADESGEFPVAYAIPSTFGMLNGIELMVGAPEGEDQVRYSTILQTPAENTFVYSGESC